MVDHALLLISGSALAWFKSYLSDRTHCVVVDSEMSQVIHVLCSVPLGSVVVPTVHSRLGRASCKIWCYATCLC